MNAKHALMALSLLACASQAAPEKSLQQVLGFVSSEVVSRVEKTLPSSAHSVYITNVNGLLTQGKYSEGRFSDFMGSLTIIARNGESRRYYQARCANVFATVNDAYTGEPSEVAAPLNLQDGFFVHLLTLDCVIEKL